MANIREISEMNIYHVMNRGTGKQLIFEDDRDRGAFLELVAESLTAQKVRALGWCLMGNHFHLLLQGELESISLCMMKACSKYARRFNSRHGRTGHLFQGVFPSEAINDDSYLLTVIRYIHRNPVKAGLSASCEYMWSSYLEYAKGYAPSGMRCDTRLVNGLFASVEEFEEFHGRNEGASREHSDAYILSVSDCILGPGAAGKVKELGRRERNAALAKLKEAGLSVRQIQHITGIGRNIVQRAG